MNGGDGERPVRPPRRDGGFTLVELLIAIVLSGIIAGVTVAAMATSLNVASSTSQEVADSTDAGLISSFLFRDAQAAGATDPSTAAADAGFGVATAASTRDPVVGWGGCAQSGTFVARFSWLDARPASARHATVATYALDADHQLTRRLCDNATTSDVVLGRSITDASATCVPDAACTDLGGSVGMTLSGSGTRAPFTYTLTASLRVDAQARPSAANSTAVALLALGDARATTACPNLTLDGSTPITVLGNVVVGSDCGAAPISGDRTLLRPTGTISTIAGVTDPFSSVAAPAQPCGGGKNPGPVGNNPHTSASVVYPVPVSISGPVQFEPGTYIFCAGLDIGVGSTVVGSDVFLVVAGGTLAISDQAEVRLSADRAGGHANLLFWVTTSQKVTLGSGSMSDTLGGYVYAPTSLVVIGGAGSMNIGGVVAQRVVIGSIASLRLGLPVPVVSIAPSALPVGQVGVAYPAAALAATGGAAPYRWSATGLPPGLALDAATGAVSGRPTTSGAFDLTVTTLDSTSAAASRTYTVVINPPLAVAGPVALPAGQVGVVYPSAIATATGGTAPLTWSATGLPGGLSIAAASGAIVGTPTTAGAFTVTTSVTDAVGAVATRTFAVSINPPLAITTRSLPGGQVGVAYPSTAVQSSGGTAAYAWSATGLPAGLSISAAGLITGTPTVSGSFAVVVQAVDGAHATANANYTLTINAALAVGTTALSKGQVGTPYPATKLAPSGGTGPYSWSAVGLPSGLTLDASTGILSGSPQTAGTSDLVVTVVDSLGASSAATYSLTINPQPVITGPSSLPTGRAASTYPSTTVVATGGTVPYTWTSTGLPSGLVLDRATGVISGTPAASGSYSVTITVTDSINASATVSRPIVVASSLTITTSSLPATQLGATYSTPVAASGGAAPYSWSATGLPAGLTMSAAGVISGTAKAAGTFSVVAKVVDAGAVTATAPYDLVVSSVPAGCPASPSGWRAEYFANVSLTGPATLCRDDAAINFDWSTGSAAAGLPTDNFSVRWTRAQDFAAGTYIFSLGSDDGGRLYIDGVLVLDRWVDQPYPSPVPTTSQTLTAGSHEIVMQYYERAGSASATLSWAVYASVTCPSSPTGWTGQYYANNALAGSPVLCRDDATINFDWAGGSPASAVPIDNFSVRWTRTKTFAAGTYTFAVGSDDGGRLYIDGTLVLDRWVDQSYPSPVPSVTRALTAGAHTLVMEYYERGGSARAALNQTP